MERVRSQIGLRVSLLEYLRLWESLEVKFQRTGKMFLLSLSKKHQPN